eukprot:scaffold156130_cov31-Tisochrysis_lutea.AAC.2
MQPHNAASRACQQPKHTKRPAPPLPPSRRPKVVHMHVCMWHMAHGPTPQNRRKRNGGGAGRGEVVGAKAKSAHRASAHNCVWSAGGYSAHQQNQVPVVVLPSTPPKSQQDQIPAPLHGEGSSIAVMGVVESRRHRRHPSGCHEIGLLVSLRQHLGSWPPLASRRNILQSGEPGDMQGARPRKQAAATNQLASACIGHRGILFPRWA